MILSIGACHSSAHVIIRSVHFIEEIIIPERTQYHHAIVSQCFRINALLHPMLTTGNADKRAVIRKYRGVLSGPKALAGFYRLRKPLLRTKLSLCATLSEAQVTEPYYPNKQLPQLHP